MNNIIISMILTIFPILIYLVFSNVNSLCDGVVKRMIFIVTICTSLYLNLTLNTSREVLIFCNIPIIICYIKKEELLAVLLSFVVILYSYILYDFNIYTLLIKYLCYFSIYLLLFKKRNFVLLFINTSAAIQGISIYFEYNRIINMIGYVVIIYGITFLVLYLFKIANDINSLYVTYGKIIKENELKDSLFKLTHEIKNPIAVCKGYLDMIDYNNIDIKYVKIIKSEIDRSLNVISEFVDYNKVKVNKDIMDIVMLIDEVCDSFKILVKSKNIKFIYDNNYDEIYLMGDYDRLKQVFINIIKNSIESIENNGIINVGITKLEKQVEITIVDSGVGMDKEELASIKKMFFTTKKNGTGLGVALSNEIVLAHNGALLYDSLKNEGTKCIVKLPI